MNIGQVFDEIQEEYTDKMIRWVPHYLQLIEQFSKSFRGDFNPRQILDLGSGNGNITATLLQRFPAAYYTLLDASEKMLEEAKLRFLNYPFTYHLGLMQHVKYPDNYFDLIAASFSLHHLNPDVKEQVLRDSYRWLKTDGIFAYADLFVHKDDPDHPAFYEKWKNFVLRHPSNGDWEYLADHYQQYDAPDNLTTQLEWLRKLDFREIRINIFERYWVFINATK
jgi:tRNA (cmo5U34)-methyltransferase